MEIFREFPKNWITEKIRRKKRKKKDLADKLPKTICEFTDKDFVGNVCDHKFPGNFSMF